jgi:hypothetical protein
MEAYRGILLGPPFPLMGKGRDRGAREPINPITPTFVLPHQQTVSQSENRTRVILSPSEGSAFLRYSCRIGVVFRSYKTKKQILRRSTPQNDIATQAPKGRNPGRPFHDMTDRLETVLRTFLTRSRLIDCESSDHRRRGTRGQPSCSRIGVRA